MPGGRGEPFVSFQSLSYLCNDYIKRGYLLTDLTVVTKPSRTNHCDCIQSNEPIGTRRKMQPRRENRGKNKQAQGEKALEKQPQEKKVLDSHDLASDWLERHVINSLLSRFIARDLRLNDLAKQIQTREVRQPNGLFFRFRIDRGGPVRTSSFSKIFVNFNLWPKTQGNNFVYTSVIVLVLLVNTNMHTSLMRFYLLSTLKRSQTTSGFLNCLHYAGTPKAIKPIMDFSLHQKR